MANIKFKAFYCSRCSSLAGTCGRAYSFFLAFASTGSVAAWAIWRQHSAVWAIIVAVAQVFHIAKPYIPFLGKETDFLVMSFDFERLYLQYERLWYDFEGDRIQADEAEVIFYQYREREIEIEQTHKSSSCPEIGFLIRKAQRETDSALALNFETGGES
ncbi:MAG: hypothetical protein U1E27_04015 [Kiritimatiellia bacterium]|nr:hypothetical protein [Kiritimatiellia bacterium]